MPLLLLLLSHRRLRGRVVVAERKSGLLLVVLLVLRWGLSLLLLLLRARRRDLRGRRDLRRRWSLVGCRRHRRRRRGSRSRRCPPPNGSGGRRKLVLAGLLRPFLPVDRAARRRRRGCRRPAVAAHRQAVVPGGRRRRSRSRCLRRRRRRRPPPSAVLRGCGRGTAPSAPRCRCRFCGRRRRRRRRLPRPAVRAAVSSAQWDGLHLVVSEVKKSVVAAKGTSRRHRFKELAPRFPVTKTWVRLGVGIVRASRHSQTYVQIATHVRAPTRQEDARRMEYNKSYQTRHSRRKVTGTPYVRRNTMLETTQDAQKAQRKLVTRILTKDALLAQSGSEGNKRLNHCRSRSVRSISTHLPKTRTAIGVLQRRENYNSKLNRTQRFHLTLSRATGSSRFLPRKTLPSLAFPVPPLYITRHGKSKKGRHNASSLTCTPSLAGCPLSPHPSTPSVTAALSPQPPASTDRTCPLTGDGGGLAPPPLAWPPFLLFPPPPRPPRPPGPEAEP